MQASFAKTVAIRTTAIPLGKATPGCGAEDFNAHGDTCSDATNEGDMKWKEPASQSGRYLGAME
jgi:hypothetical protein